MAIDFKCSEYEDNIDTWELIDNICEAENVQRYLVELNPQDKSENNKIRNAQYKERAVFYPIAQRTLQGLNSLLFADWPKLVIPTQLDYLSTNADGSGVSIYQQSQCVAEDVIAIARGGLFVTYPETEGPLSRADMDSGNYFATIHEIDADRIINWRQVKVGSQMKLGLVVFTESVEVVGDDGYSTESVDQMRELALENGVFVDRKWRKNAKDEWEVYAEAVPQDGNGNAWAEIPFTFVGATSNAPAVDDSIMYGIASLNKAHYRNSADYEDNVWYCGQSQPWMSGVTQTHIDLMSDNKMYVGSRSLLGVPTGETFDFASAPPNPLVRQAMMDKLDAMIGLGARYIQPNGVAKTATESKGDQAVSHSALSMIAGNISEAYTRCIEWCAQYMNATLPTDYGYTLTQEFVDPDVSPQEIQAMVAGFLGGAIPASDYFRWLQRSDLTDSEKTLEDWLEESAPTDMPALDQE